jgi:hypothetical protein
MTLPYERARVRFFAAFPANIRIPLALACGIFVLPILVACSSDGDPVEIPTPLPTFTPRAVEMNPLTSDMAHLDSSQSLPGTYIPPHPGMDGRPNSGDEENHFASGTIVPICTAAQLAANNVSNPLCYHSNPPTSGPHSQNWAPTQVLESPAPKETLVHSMEHGNVVIWYNTSDQGVIGQLTQIANEELQCGRLVVMSRYVEMEPDTIALTSWTRLDKFPAAQLNRSRITDFIGKHQRRYNPEGF